jgi:hypothetical protein
VKLKDGTNSSEVDRICENASINKATYSGYCLQKYEYLPKIKNKQIPC